MDTSNYENGIWDSVFFVNESTSFLFGTSAQTGSELLKKSLLEATQWLNINTVKRFNISHDVSIYKNPGCEVLQATVVIVYSTIKDDNASLNGGF